MPALRKVISAKVLSKHRRASTSFTDARAEHWTWTPCKPSTRKRITALASTELKHHTVNKTDALTMPKISQNFSFFRGGGDDLEQVKPEHVFHSFHMKTPVRFSFCVSYRVSCEVYTSQCVSVQSGWVDRCGSLLPLPIIPSKTTKKNGCKVSSESCFITIQTNF